METNPLLHNRAKEGGELMRETLALRLTVVRGTNLLAKDHFSRSSDPYVLVIMGDQMLKTNIVKKNLNPEWNQEMNLTVTDPTQTIRFEVYDKDTFTKDDAMGSAELDISSFIEAVRMHQKNIANGEEHKLGSVAWGRGKVTQDVILGLKLHNAASGELVLQLSAS